MKLREILSERDDAFEPWDGREYKNPLPLPKDTMALGEIFDYMEGVDQVIMDKFYRANQNKTAFSGGAAGYGKFIKEERKKYGTIETVPFSNIVATEPHLDESHLKAIMQGQGTKKSSEFPLVYKRGNTYYLGDGNHRAAAAFLNKEKGFKALVLDGDKIIQER